jgi:uncharacterized membrane protein
LVKPLDKPADIAAKLLRKSYADLDDRAKQVAKHVAEHRHISRNLANDTSAQATAGQRAADAVARFGGSWTFVGLFALVMLVWVGLNALLLIRGSQAFDPYPYILLNLFLSMLAAIQAPIILMSQNRQSQKDRATAEHDYEVNLKAELEIMLLHEKIDVLREKQWEELIVLQQRQLELLSHLTGKNPIAP